MALSATQGELAAKIVAEITERSILPGARLTEEGLTEIFQVSRSPVRSVLRHLAEAGVLERRGRSFYVAEQPLESGAAAELVAASADRVLMEAIARDRIHNVLPEQLSEAELLRRYDVSRGQLVRVLAKLANDGFLERRPGHGWRFLPSLSSPEANAASYRFRMIVEPAGILEPGFRADRDKLNRIRDLHLGLAEEAEPSSERMFEINASLHEMIASFSGNVFILRAIQQQNRLRRLGEQFVPHAARMRPRIEEHLAIIDALLADDRPWAASLLQRHLELASRVPYPA